MAPADSASKDPRTAPSGTARSGQVAMMLMRAVQAGDRRAFAKLYDLYTPRLNALALKILGNATDAEDVLQQTWLETWNRAKDFDGRRGSVGGWLLTRTRSRAIDLLRRRRSQRLRVAARGAADTGEREPAPANADAELRMDSAEAETALDGLRAEYRGVLRIAYFEGKSQSEIAELLGVPLGSVKTWMRRGLEELRQRMGEGGTR